ncbi:hypothetical protein [Herbaspirillum huttiense]|uniref:Uncharacterized protein n=1 Tax=Herbaspirillum huttiense subsp. lycopersici TaxID=3074428 RepID=A0ABU2EG29_9BURK|nr:hypothetical protein [Herbaspirillum huttiense]MDR9847089.1 hypothetical protein [Herbaspirillum huttiense SE1]
MKGQRYKDTIAGKGSALAAAIEESPTAAKKVYEETTARFDALYPGAKEDRLWFNQMQKGGANAAQEALQ